MGREKVLILTPLFAQGGSGAATYYHLLSRWLTQRGIDVTVLSEPGTEGLPCGVRFRAVLPHRAARDRSLWRDRWAYAKQNLSYLQMEAIFREEAPDAALIHSSFLNLPGVFPWVLERLRRKQPNVRFVLDVRDCLLPASRTPTLSYFDSVIACSKNILAHLSRLGTEEARTNHIPVVQESLVISENRVRTVKEEHSLQSPYLLYAGLVKEEKNAHHLLEAYHRHFRLLSEELQLVVAGFMKFRSRRNMERIDKPGVRFLGNLERESTLALMAGAEICVNPSQNEGMPRSSLEPLALGCRTLLPAGVPEFETHCAPWVMDSPKPNRLARQLWHLLQRDDRPGYPISDHSTHVVFPQYLQPLGLRGQEAPTTGVEEVEDSP